jgi:hypothetical protein
LEYYNTTDRRLYPTFHLHQPPTINERISPTEWQNTMIAPAQSTTNHIYNECLYDNDEQGTVTIGDRSGCCLPNDS